MMEEKLCAKLAHGLEVDLEEKKKIDNLLLEISRLNHVEKLLLYLKLPGETSIFRSQQKKDSLAESISIQWIKSHLKPDPNFSLLKKNVYENYKAFCLSNKHPFVSLNDFGKNLRSTMNTVHHRRLGRRGEALYAYAGVNYIDGAMPFVAPGLLDQKLSKQSDHSSDEEYVGSDCEDSDDFCGVAETCKKWKSCVSLAVRNLILEWAEKVIDKSIKFRRYKELAQHLFNQNYVNKNSRDAYILLSDMNQSDSNRLASPKITTSSSGLSNNFKPDECHSMQSQTKQKLYNTLTKRDELRQQKKRAQLEEYSQKGALLKCSKTNKTRSVSSSGPSPMSLKMNAINVPPKRPASAHQKVILPKIARIQDPGFPQGSGLEATNKFSTGNFFLLPPKATNNSNVSPVIIALFSGQPMLPNDQVSQVNEGNPKTHVKPGGQQMISQEAYHSTNVLNSPLLVPDTVSPNFLENHDSSLDLNIQLNGSKQANKFKNDNSNAPDVLKKVYKDSKFIASVLSDAASNPFGSENKVPCDRKSSTYNYISNVIKSKASTIRNTFSNQTVSSLLNCQRASAPNLTKSLAYVKLASDRRPVAKILRDKRERLHSHTSSKNFPFPIISPMQNSISLIEAKDRQINKFNEDLIASKVISSISENISLENTGEKSSIYRSTNITEGVNQCDTLENEVSKDAIELPSKCNLEDSLMVFNEVSQSSSTDSEHLETVKSHLFQILNEPKIHSDGSVVFQKSINPSEILLWFESQENNHIIEGTTENNKVHNGTKNFEKNLHKNPVLADSEDRPNENLLLCSSMFHNDNGCDDMPYNNSFAHNFTLQQLSEVLKSKLESMEVEGASGHLKNHSHLSSISLRKKECRPLSASLMTDAGRNKDHNSSLSLSRPGTATSAIIENDEKMHGHVSYFTPVKMAESVSPGISGVKHPQPLIPTNGKMTCSIGISKKINETLWSSLLDCENSEKRSFAPYSGNCKSTSLTGLQVVSKKFSRLKEFDHSDPTLLPEEGLCAYLSSERQRHSSAHEMSKVSNNDPWMIMSGAEAEVDSILQQGFGDIVSGSSSALMLSRCHSEPVKYCVANFLPNSSNVLLENDDSSIRTGDKIDELPNKDADIDPSSLGIYFEDEDIVNFNLWNSSSE